MPHRRERFVRKLFNEEVCGRTYRIVKEEINYTMLNDLNFAYYYNYYLEQCTLLEIAN